MNRYVPLFTLLVSTSCHADMVVFDNELFHKYSKLLSLDLDVSETLESSGYYATNKNGDLHGKFRVGFSSSGHDEELGTEFNYINAVEGEFISGKKQGIWRYQYTSDDGIDMYESHLITITFQGGSCLQSSFFGVIGHVMPKTECVFTSAKLCTPKSVREKAWDLWSVKYESEKAKSGL